MAGARFGLASVYAACVPPAYRCSELVVLVRALGSAFDRFGHPGRLGVGWLPVGSLLCARAVLSPGGPPWPAEGVYAAVAFELALGALSRRWTRWATGAASRALLWGASGPAGTSLASSWRPCWYAVWPFGPWDSCGRCRPYSPPLCLWGSLGPRCPVGPRWRPGTFWTSWCPLAASGKWGLRRGAPRSWSCWSWALGTWDPVDPRARFSLVALRPERLGPVA